MELCGDSLFSVLHTPAECHWRGAAKRIPEAQTVRWATGVAEAMAFLHAQSPRIVHRDLKSHNLLLAADGRLKLCDFGLVHHPEPGAGTPQYMAPELLAGARSGFSDRVDVFAFGVLLWEVSGSAAGKGSCNRRMRAHCSALLRMVPLSALAPGPRPR